MTEVIRMEKGLLGCLLIDHPPYSPDLAPIDVHIFPIVKSALKGHRFDSFQKLLYAVHCVVSDLGSMWITDMFDQWISWHQKRISVQVGYIEKWLNYALWTRLLHYVAWCHLRTFTVHACRLLTLCLYSYNYYLLCYCFEILTYRAVKIWHTDVRFSLLSYIKHDSNWLSPVNSGSLLVCSSFFGSDKHS